MISLNNMPMSTPQQQGVDGEESNSVVGGLQPNLQAPPGTDTSQGAVSGSGGQAVKVNGASIQAPLDPVNSASKNLEGVQKREAQENVAKMGLPELTSPKGGSYAQSTASMFAQVTVEAMSQQRRAAADVQNSSLEGMVNKMLQAAKDIQEQSKLMMGLGIASAVVTTAMGVGGSVGGVKSMTSNPGPAAAPQAQVTPNKLTLGKEIAEGMRAGMDTGKEGQVKALDSEIKTTSAEEKKMEQQMEMVKQFAENLKQLGQQAMAIMQEVTREANETTKRVLA